ncbi:MAG: hypothetical protein KAQ92_02310, partial [Candidatus Aenigmarchaeota archaeon]|nr:hypothetical protein [Candidatus Aenigmarchaeota archaeon]
NNPLTEIYRDDEYANTVVNNTLAFNTTYLVNATNQNNQSIENATIMFYYNHTQNSSLTYFANCTTNASGICNATFNPGNYFIPEEHSVLFYTYKNLYYDSSLVRHDISLRAFSRPTIIEPHYQMFYNESENPTINFSCNITETFNSTTGIGSGYPIAMFVGQKEEDLIISLNQSWVNYGEGVINQSDNLLLETNSSITAGNALSGAGNLYDKFSITISSISSNSTWNVVLSNTTSNQTIFINNSKTGTFIEDINIGSPNNIYISLNNISSTNTSNISIGSISFIDTYLENSTEISNSIVVNNEAFAGQNSSGDMEDIILNSGTPTAWDDLGWWNLGNNISSNDNLTYVKRGIRSLKINLDGLSKGEEVSVLKRFGAAGSDIFENYIYLGFWIYDLNVPIDLNFTIYKDTPCSYSTNITLNLDPLEKEGWSYYNISLRDYLAKCGTAFNSYEEYKFTFNYTGTQQITNKSIYIDQIILLEPMETDLNGTATAEWYPIEFGNWWYMCNITDNSYYDASTEKAFKKIYFANLGENGSEEDRTGNRGEAPGTGENYTYNLTSFNITPISSDKLIGINNSGQMQEFTIQDKNTVGCEYAIGMGLYGTGWTFLNATYEGAVVDRITLSPDAQKQITIVYNSQ